MSIIHDALKKVQQGLGPKPDETVPVTKTAESDPGYLYGTTAKPATQDAQQSAARLDLPAKNKVKSILALICALAITIAALGFFYKQLNTYVPQFKRSMKSSFYKLIHKEEIPEFKTRSPQDLVPLAKLTVNEPVPVASTNVPGIPNTPKPDAPVTLNIHGVMSNGASNLVLINDQVYQEGDDVDGIKIVKINLNSIRVINNGKEENIRVKN